MYTLCTHPEGQQGKPMCTRCVHKWDPQDCFYWKHQGTLCTIACVHSVLCTQSTIHTYIHTFQTQRTPPRVSQTINMTIVLQYDMKEELYPARIIARMTADESVYLRSKGNVSEYLRKIVDSDIRQKRLPSQTKKK